MLSQFLKLASQCDQFGTQFFHLFSAGAFRRRRGDVFGAASKLKETVTKPVGLLWSQDDSVGWNRRPRDVVALLVRTLLARGRAKLAWPPSAALCDFLTAPLAGR